MSSSAFSKRQKFFCAGPSNWSYVRNQHKQVFWGPRNFRILRIFKPPFKWLGSYKFRWSFLSRNSCLIPDSGSTPKWVPPSSLLTSWRMQSVRKGSCPTGHPFCTYLWLTSSRPRKNLNFSRSSFRTRHTSACPFTPMGTMRNTLHTSLQSSVSSMTRGCPRSAGCLPRLLQDGQRHWRISKKPQFLEKPSQQVLMLQPARWRCRRPFCPKPEVQHNRRGKGMPTLTWEEVTIREGVVVVPKRKLWA